MDNDARDKWVRSEFEHRLTPEYLNTLYYLRLVTSDEGRKPHFCPPRPPYKSFRPFIVIQGSGAKGGWQGAVLDEIVTDRVKA